MQQHWYVIQTKPKKENEVQQQLTRAQYELFYPRMKSLISTKPLFPSYLFIRTDLGNPYHHRMVRYTRGVRKILGDLESPYTVSDYVVETLQERTRDGSVIEQELLFREGDIVRVKKGILQDLRGIIEKSIPETGRVKILFRWLQNSMRAALKYTELEKV